MNPRHLQREWQSILSRLETEVAELPAGERTWLERQVGQIESVQAELNALFGLAEGEDICRDCRGACCAKGLNHLTLANLLTYLLRGESLPTPDFSSTCPLLGPSGCLWTAERRPFNCVTFLCDSIEERLSEDRVEQFYALEKKLRELYNACDLRYAGSSLRGIWIALDRLGSGNFLKRR